MDPTFDSGRPIPTPVELPRGFEIHSDFYWLNSPKNGRPMKYFSALEYQHGLLLEGTPEALRYCEQPRKIKLRDKWYVFDCWILWIDHREEMREIKPSGKLVPTDTGAKVPARWPEIAEWCAKEGYLANFVTEATLEPYARFISNWERLVPYVLEARELPRPDLEKALVIAVGNSPRITLGQLFRTLAPERQGNVMAAIANLLHQGRLLADLQHQPVNPMLELTLSLRHAGA